MTPAFKTVALIGRYKSRDVAGPLLELGRYLQGAGCTVLVDADTAAASGVDAFPGASFEEIGRRADLAAVLGGDGSMLSAARTLVPFGVPLVGVNQGRLGFMTDIALGSMVRSMAQILAGEFTLEERTMLRVEVERGGTTIFETLALNDAVVNKGATGRLIESVVRIDGQFIYDLRSDGLIVATPTGSTAYALSANGPILQPGVSAFALVPICPHMLSNRPIAVPDSSRIEVTLKTGADARLHYDGQPQCDLVEGDRVVVRLAERTTRFVHPPGYDYYAMLREKLRWSESLF